MGLLEFPDTICDVTHHNSLETYLIYPMIAISSLPLWDSFYSRVYIYAYRMRYLHHEVHELDEYNHEFL